MSELLQVGIRDVRDLQRSLHASFKCVTSWLSGLDSPDFAWDTRHELDKKSEPWRYYRLQVDCNSMYIHRRRDGCFSLEVYGFSPRFVKPYKSKHGSYRNYFGDYKTYQEALPDFARESYNLLLDISGVLF